MGHRLPIKKLGDLQDSLSILKSSSARHDLVQDPDAERLARKLDGLPLALATAGAYLHQTPAVSYADYIRYYENSWAKLPKTSPRLISYEDRTLYSTWQISFDQIEKQSELAPNLLRLWAYFDNQDLWFELLRNARSWAPKWLQDLVIDELDFHNHMRILCNHGLVEKDTAAAHGSESQGYSVHACLHRWTQTVLNVAWDWDLGEVALRCIAWHVPGTDSQQWLMLSRRLLNHAATWERKLDPDSYPHHDLGWTFGSLGCLYASQARLHEAERMFQRALRMYRQHGSESTESAQRNVCLIFNHLANIFMYHGKLDKPELMFEQALHGYQKFGPESTLDTLHDLAHRWRKQEKLDKAEQTLEQVLRGYENACKPEKTLKVVCSLGTVYRDQGKLVAAEQMYKRVSQEEENSLGHDDTSTLSTVHELGVIYEVQRKLEKAELMFTRVLQGMEKALGPDHTSTLSAVHSLGVVYKHQRKLEEAERMYMRALRGREKALDPTHSAIHDALCPLGNVYIKQSKLKEAELVYNRALQGREKTRGPLHYSTLDTVDCLAVTYKDQGKLEEAEQMYKRALQGREKTLGRTHPSTLRSLTCLGDFYNHQKRPEDAAQMYQRVLRGMEETLGPDHASTLDTVRMLANPYMVHNFGDPEEAEQRYWRVFEGYRRGVFLVPMQIEDMGDSLLDLYRRDSRAHFARSNGVRSRMVPSTSTRRQARSLDIRRKVAELYTSSEALKALLMIQLGVPGRILMWLGDSGDAVAIFQYYKSLPHGPWCDGCDRPLCATEKHFVCKSCLDTDLCAACYGKYTAGLDCSDMMQVPECSDHEFLEVPAMASIASEGEPTIDGLTVIQWMERLLHRHSGKDFPSHGLLEE